MGDIIEVYKILTVNMMHQQHCKLLELILQLHIVVNFRFEKVWCKYDLCKYYFTSGIVNILNFFYLIMVYLLSLITVLNLV